MPALLRRQNQVRGRLNNEALFFFFLWEIQGKAGQTVEERLLGFILGALAHVGGL